MSNSFIGYDWETINSTFSEEFGQVHIYKQKVLGELHITDDAKEEISTNYDTKDIYKFASIVRENNLKFNRTLVCMENQRILSQKYKSGLINTLIFENIISDFPNDIIEKQERSLINFSRIQPIYGKAIDFFNYYDCFSRDDEECSFILNCMHEKEFINHGFMYSPDGYFNINNLQLREKGWIQIEKIRKNELSKQAFVAMWFDNSMDNAYLSIEKSCLINGYKAFRIDNKEHNNEISGEILTEIRKSKFLISEVTGQRHGVYFEAGYALAFGIPVIWCCKSEKLKNVHFDTRQYNHVVWDNEEDLFEKMNKRIKGTII